MVMALWHVNEWPIFRPVAPLVRFLNSPLLAGRKADLPAFAPEGRYGEVTPKRSAGGKVGLYGNVTRHGSVTPTET